MPPLPTAASQSEDLVRDLPWWRARLLDRLLAGTVVLGGVTCVIGVVISLQSGNWGAATVMLVTYLAALTVQRWRALSFRVRAASAIALCWAMAVFLTVGWGPVTAGDLFLLAVPIMTAILFGRRGSYVALGIVFATEVVLAVLIVNGWLSWTHVAVPFGHLFPFIARAASLLFLSGLGAIGIATLSEGLAREVAARADAERERLELAAAIEQSSDLILLFDAAGGIRYANAVTRQAVGPDRAHFAGESIVEWFERLEIIDGDPRQPAEAWHALLAGQTWRGTVRFLEPRPPLPRGYTVSGTVSPMRREDGSVSAVLAVFRDVRRERELEEQLRRSTKLQAIGTLVSGIAHDFNNLLQPILLDSDLLRERIQADPDALVLLDDVRHSAQRGRSLIRRILTFTREAELQRAPILLGPVVRETMQLVRASLPSTVDVQWHCESGLSVRADGGEVQQVLLNLATNAAHAMPQGGALRVRVARVPVDRSAVQQRAFPGVAEVIELEVSDTGVGMDEATLARIFEPFFTTKPPGSGTGLGLAMVHGTVTALGGIIVPQSVPGHGTTMRVLLPLAPDVVDAPPTSPTLRTGEGAGRRVLLVDDEPAVLRAAERLLRQAGHDVVPCADPREALDALATTEQPFDCVVTDLSMPHLTGLELAAQLRARDAALPVVLVTGYLDHEDLTAAPSVGVDHVLVKPYSSEALLELVARVARAPAVR